MDSKICWVLAALLSMPAVSSAAPAPGKPGEPPPSAEADKKKDDGWGENDAAVLAVMRDLNEGLRAEWMDLRAQQVALLGSGHERSGARIQPRDFRWVPGDPRRGARPAGVLTYLIDASDGVPSAGVTPEQVDLALARAAEQWGSVSCTQPLLERRPDQGGDPDIFDSVYAYGERGTYPIADVVFAGFLPAGFFDLVVPPSGDDVVALSITFVFVDLDGNPTDLDRDGYLDAALSEIYFNDRFSWSTENLPGTVDVESVALHELGHSLGIGHIGSPPPAVMSPVYLGPRRYLRPLDRASLCAVWGQHR